MLELTIQATDVPSERAIPCRTFTYSFGELRTWIEREQEAALHFKERRRTGRVLGRCLEFSGDDALRRKAEAVAVERDGPFEVAHRQGDHVEMRFHGRSDSLVGLVGSEPAKTVPRREPRGDTSLGEPQAPIGNHRRTETNGAPYYSMVGMRMCRPPSRTVRIRPTLSSNGSALRDRKDWQLRAYLSAASASRSFCLQSR